MKMRYGQRRFLPWPQALIRCGVLAAPLGLSHASSSGDWGNLNAPCREVRGEHQDGPQALSARWRATLAAQLRRADSGGNWSGAAVARRPPTRLPARQLQALATARGRRA